jgi:hypothetical protein
MIEIRFSETLEALCIHTWLIVQENFINYVQAIWEPEIICFKRIVLPITVAGRTKKRISSSAETLKLCVRIPLGAQMYICAFLFIAMWGRNFGIGPSHAQEILRNVAKRDSETR